MKYLNKLLLAGYEVECVYHADMPQPFCVTVHRFKDGCIVESNIVTRDLCEEALQHQCKHFKVK